VGRPISRKPFPEKSLLGDPWQLLTQKRLRLVSQHPATRCGESDLEPRLDPLLVDRHRRSLQHFLTSRVDGDQSALPRAAPASGSAADAVRDPSRQEVRQSGPAYGAGEQLHGEGRPRLGETRAYQGRRREGIALHVVHMELEIADLVAPADLLVGLVASPVDAAQPAAKLFPTRHGWRIDQPGRPGSKFGCSLPAFPSPQEGRPHQNGCCSNA
jgi:hypothetical protein